MAMRYYVVSIVIIVYILACLQFLVSTSPSYTNYMARIKSKITNAPMPIIIIHIGPRKTATTYIQQSLFDVNKKHLAKDSFVYIDKGVNGKRLYEKDKDKRRNFENKLEELRLSGTNVILSDEKLSRIFITDKDLYKLKYRLPGWRIRIVATYRRYFEWFLSEYDQEFMRNSKAIHMKSKTLINYYRTIDTNPLLKPLNISLWKSHFDDVYVFNMHNEIIIEYGKNHTTKATNSKAKKKYYGIKTLDNQLFTRFMCEAIPEATHVCNGLKNKKIIGSPPKNRAEDKVSPEGLLITKILKNRDLILFHKENARKNLKFAELVDQYLLEFYEGRKSHLDLNKYDMLNCLSKSNRTQLYDKSIEIEKDFLPAFHEFENGLSLLKLSFDEADKSKKFCQLDVIKFLETESNNLVIMMLDNYK